MPNLRPPRLGALLRAPDAPPLRSELAFPGMRIGLFGGSFNPVHEGHLHVAREAKRRLGLDRVWWLVSPGNPLKADAPADLSRRLAQARAVVRDRRAVVTDVEARIGTRYTAATLRALRSRYPGVRFVWLMGADNLRSFHHWDRWATILEQVPVGVLARPGEQVKAGLSPAARRFARWRVPQSQAAMLPLMAPPAWTLLSGPMLDLSSTELRATGKWRR